jgi:hypothetical protein
VEVSEIAPGLYRWTARHPGWRAGAKSGSPGDWPPEVGCVAWLAPDALVTIDALMPREGDALPAGVEAIPIRGAGETMFWIGEHRALVPGDRLLGDGRGGLRLCPESWMRYLRRPLSAERLSRLLRPLLELPIEAVLVSHGEPVLEDGGGCSLAPWMPEIRDAQAQP